MKFFTRLASTLHPTLAVGRETFAWQQDCAKVPRAPWQVQIKAKLLLLAEMINANMTFVLKRVLYLLQLMKRNEFAIANYNNLPWASRYTTTTQKQ